MKGSITITDTISLFVIPLIILVLLSLLIKSFIEIIADSLISASTEAMSRTISSLITASGSATYKAEITYQTPKKTEQKLVIINRTVEVDGSKSSCDVPVENVINKKFTELKIRKTFDGVFRYEVE